MGTRRRILIGACVVVALALVAGVTVAASSAKSAPHTARPGRPDALMVDGLRGAPIGVDPDDVSFAWHVVDHRQNAQQRGYELVVSRRRHGHVVWRTTDPTSARQAFVAYRGPRLAPDTKYWWTVATRDEYGKQSRFARPQPFVTALRDADWRAQWLRPGPANPGGEEYTYLRTVPRLARSPIVRATAYVAAAHQYQLWINGRQLAAGPSFAYPDEQYFQTTDVTHALHAGEPNAIGVLHHWYGAGQGRPLSTPGLIVQISVWHRNGTHELITSNGTWRQHAAEWLVPAPLRNDEGDHVEHIDARRAPLGWSQPSFDSATWTPVTVLGPAVTQPFSHLVAQRTRIIETPLHPRSVRTLASGAVVADFGAIVAARPTVRFRAGHAGRVVDMHVGAALDPNGAVSTTHAEQDTNQSYQYIERAGAQTFVPYTYLGFRYLEIDTPGEPLTANQLVARVRHTDMPVPAATFRSSNPTLDAVFRMLEHTAVSVSQEQFVDTPTREKGQFLADSFNDSLAVMTTFGDQNLSWQALRDFARSQARYWPDGELNAVYPNGDGKRTFLDFTERYPEWLWQYYRATGDGATLARFYPVVRNVASFLWHETDPATGLLTPPPGGTDETYGLIDWPPAMRYGYDGNTRVRTTSAVLAANVFRRTAAIATLLGHPGDTATFTARATTAIDGINRHLRRPDGLYIDGLAPDGTPSAHASQQANAFALSYGIVPHVNTAAVARYVAFLGISTGPMDGLELLHGLANGGRADDVVRVLSDTKDPGWAHVVAAGGTFSWESWTPLDILGDSMSHGWGSSALVAFADTFLGVSTTRPPDDRNGLQLRLTAPPPSLPSVAGTLPTVAGPVTVQWQRRPDRVVLHIVLPPNVTARFDNTNVNPGRWVVTRTATALAVIPWGR